MLFSFMKEVMVMGLDPVTGVQPKLAKVFKFNESREVDRKDGADLLERC